MPKIKRKVHWRGEASKLKHAVREVDGVHEARAVCGAVPNDNWSAPGTRSKTGDHRCAKCAAWEPRGMGPGGENYKVKA